MAVVCCRNSSTIRVPIAPCFSTLKSAAGWAADGAPMASSIQEATHERKFIGYSGWTQARGAGLPVHSVGAHPERTAIRTEVSLLPRAPGRFGGFAGARDDVRLNRVNLLGIQNLL